MENFVDTYRSVIDIQQNYSTKLSQAENQEDAQELQQKAQNKVAEAVRDSGLTLSEYNDIVMQMNQDPALRQEIVSRLQ